MSRIRILATDLDRTLLPNGASPADGEAIDIFNEYTDKFNITLVYVTGRNLHLTKQAIQEFGIRPPHVLCGDVGSTIRAYKHGDWLDDAGWPDHVARLCPKWAAAEIAKKLHGIAGLQQQESEHLNSRKQSYYLERSKKDEVLKKVNDEVAGKFDAEIIYSFDPHNNNGLLDILPKAATKRTALEYVADKFNIPHQEVVFCGDSGNDIAPLTANFKGVLVKNADEQLVENVRQAMTANKNLNAYFAKGGFLGLNGNYTSGVLEGAAHYGLFD